MERNPGGPEFRIQNQFTKYLQVAVIRTRNRYLAKKQWLDNREMFYDADSRNGFDDLLGRKQYDDSLITELELAFTVAALLEQLPENARTIVRLRVYQRYDFDEIAAITGISYVNVRNIYYRAIRRLRSQMDEQEFY